MALLKSQKRGVVEVLEKYRQWRLAILTRDLALYSNRRLLTDILEPKKVLDCFHFFYDCLLLLF